MRCDQSRDVLSARLDGEATADELAVLDRHLASCAACTDFASSLMALDRVTRLTPAEPVPDLAGAVMAANPPVRRDPRREAARWSLVVDALAQLVIALPSLLTGPCGEAVHTTRERGPVSAHQLAYESECNLPLPWFRPSGKPQRARRGTAAC